MSKVPEGIQHAVKRAGELSALRSEAHRVFEWLEEHYREDPSPATATAAMNASSAAHAYDQEEIALRRQIFVWVQAEETSVSRDYERLGKEYRECYEELEAIRNARAAAIDDLDDKLHAQRTEGA